MVHRLTKHYQLIFEMTKREVLIRYKGSYLGFLWSVVTPILMLVIYTFVFSVIFKTKWGISGTETSHMSFGLTLFAGMIVYNIFSEVLLKSTSIITSNPNYVKKVVFPLEVYPVVLFFSTLVHAGISCLVLLAAQASFEGTFHWTVVLLPLVMIPLALLSIGVGWIVSSFGVFVRDLGYMVNILVQILMFLTPVFYPIDIVPKQFQVWYKLNPLTSMIEMFRDIVIFGQIPEMLNWFIVTVFSIIIFFLGFKIFRKFKGAFSDVL